MQFGIADNGPFEIGLTVGIDFEQAGAVSPEFHVMLFGIRAETDIVFFAAGTD